MHVFKDSLKSIVRWADIILAIDFSDFVSRLSVPGPFVLSNLSMSSYTCLSVMLLKINCSFDFFLLWFMFDVEGISSSDNLGSFSRFPVTGSFGSLVLAVSVGLNDIESC